MVVAVSVEADGRDTPDADRGRRRILPVLLGSIALAVLVVATTSGERDLTMPLANPELAIPPTVQTVPIDRYGAGAWVEVGLAAGEARGATRIPGGYAFPAGLGVVVLGDDGNAWRTDLADLRSLRGIAADDRRVVAFGSKSGNEPAPAVWVSSRGEEWLSQTLPWRGAVEAITFVDGAMVAVGVQSTPAGLLGVLAREGEDGRWTTEDIPTPHARSFPVDGGFIVRTRPGTDEQFGNYSTRDFRTFEWFADSMLVTAQGGVTGVVATGSGPILRLPDLGIDVIPPSWLPVVSLWNESGRLWLQTPVALWTSTDGSRWDEIPFEREEWSSAAMAIPVGNVPRVAFEDGGILRIYEWIPAG